MKTPGTDSQQYAFDNWISGCWLFKKIAAAKKISDKQGLLWDFYDASHKSKERECWKFLGWRSCP
jgi:hypothetical protein